MSDDRIDSGSRRPRGRRAAPTKTSGLRAAIAPALAVIEPRVAAAGAWLYERRLHVFVIGATVATVTLLGGTVALLQLTAPPQREDDAAPAVSTPRPTSGESVAPGSFAPILPSPKPPVPLPPLPSSDSGSDAEQGDPPPGAGDDAAADPTPDPTPEPTKKPGRDTAPGQIKKNSPTPEPPDDGSGG